MFNGCLVFSTLAVLCHIFALCSSLISPAASHWLLCPPPACSSAWNGPFHSPVCQLEPGRAWMGTSNVTLKMRLGWMAPLCRRGSGSSFKLCFYKHIFSSRRTCVTGCLSWSDDELTLVILGRLDAIVMVIKR